MSKVWTDFLYSLSPNDRELIIAAYGMEPENFMSLIQPLRDELDNQHTERLISGHIALNGEVSISGIAGTGMLISLTPGISENGWRITRFGADYQPSGHSVHSSYLSAFNVMVFQYAVEIDSISIVNK